MELITASAGRRLTKNGKIMPAGLEVESVIRAGWDGMQWHFVRGKISHYDQTQRAYCVMFIDHRVGVDFETRMFLRPDEIWPADENLRKEYLR